MRGCARGGADVGDAFHDRGRAPRRISSQRLTDRDGDFGAVSAVLHHITAPLPLAEPRGLNLRRVAL